MSGSVPVEDRPVGGQLFAKLQRGDIVIAAKLDRLFRAQPSMSLSRMRPRF